MPRLRLVPLALRQIALWKWLGLIAALCAASVAHAAFTITGTRVVYEDAQGEANVRIRYSVGETPVLMQAWLDDGDPESQPGAQDVPFIMTPAVAHMTPGAEQVIRILRVGNLPSERETLFFFNVLEVLPDAGSDADESFVHLNMQARLKFFYRPKGLQPAPQRAVESLRFSAEPQGADGSLRLRVENPTPYYFTLGMLTLHASESDSAPALAELDSARELGPMVAPHSAMTVYLKAAGGARLPAQAQVRYTWINDQGGHVSQQGRLQ